jgi:hypothetical protein
VQQGIKEMQNPLTYNLGLKRLTSFGMTAAATPTIVGGVLKGLYGITNDMVAAIRRFLPDYSKDSTIWAYRDDDGEIIYIDASGALVYDTLANPVQAIIANVEQGRVFDNEAPLMEYLGKGIINATSRLVRPFVDESIYLNMMNNLLVRGGLTKEGYRLWNPNDSTPNKILAAAKYAFNEVAPLSKKQFGRLIDAYFDQPGPRGEKYELDNEAAGFYGLRSIKVDALKKMDFKINEFKTGIRNTRSLLTSPITKGGEISGDEIIKRYILANRQRHLVMQNLYKDVEAAKILEVPEFQLYQEFKKRQEKKAFSYLRQDRFLPLDISRSVRKEIESQRQELESEFENLKFEAPLNTEVLKDLQRLKNEMRKIPISGDFDDYIDPKDWIQDSGFFGNRSETPPLPIQPMPDANVVQAMPQQNIMQTGLTPTENALLSPAEQQIRLRQRGLA